MIIIWLGIINNILGYLGRREVRQKIDELSRRIDKLTDQIPEGYTSPKCGNK
jgi:hypothetical protein